MELDPKVMEGLRRFGDHIQRVVLQAHVNRKTWDKRIGQMLVYGYETKIGFGAAVELQSAVQRAWEAGEPVGDAACMVLVNLAITQAKAGKGTK
jgi:hypothetical protein